MDWDMDAAVEHFCALGAPGDQMVLVALLREMQTALGGSLPQVQVAILANKLQIKESLLLALIQRIPSLHLAEGHCLELCSGPNCSKRAALAAFAEKQLPSNVTLNYVPCMRLCGKGPNLRFDGTLYHGADEALLRRLLEAAKERRS